MPTDAVIAGLLCVMRPQVQGLVQGVAVGAFHEHLRPFACRQPRHRHRHGAELVHVFGQVRHHGIAQAVEPFGGFRQLGRIGADGGLKTERRQVQQFALCRFMVGKEGVILCFNGGEHRIVGQARLNQHASCMFGAACTACHLHQFGKQVFWRAEVAAEQRAVGIQHHH